MKTFLLKDKKPISKWGSIPDGYFFEGEIPEGYSLAVCPGKGYIVLDVDRKGDIYGLDNIPAHILRRLESSFNYPTKSGRHFWLKYTGKNKLLNKTTKYGLDLRTDVGYVRWYPEEDIRNVLDKISPTDRVLNNWLNDLFGYNKIKKHGKFNWNMFRTCRLFGNHNLQISYLWSFIKKKIRS